MFFWKQRNAWNVGLCFKVQARWQFHASWEKGVVPAAPFLMKGNGSTITAIMFCTHRNVGPVWWWSVMSWQYFAITCPFHPIPKWWPALLLINGCWGATPGQMGRFVLKHALKGATPPGLLGIFGSPRHSTEFLKILKFFFLKWQNSAAICWELSRDLCRTATTVHLPYFHIGFDVIPSCI